MRETVRPKDSYSPAQPNPARRSNQKHDAVLQAVAAILMEKGSTGITIEAIAARAGVGKQTIYRWWHSKTEVLMELYAMEFQLWFDEMNVNASDPGDIQADLVTQTRSIWKFWRETASGQALRSIIADAQAETMALAQLREQFESQLRSHASTLLQHMLARGELPIKADLDVVVDMYLGFNWYRLLTNKLDDGGEVIETMVHILLDGIRVSQRTS
jgi:AcrR family transcriptional regulator